MRKPLVVTLLSALALAAPAAAGLPRGGTLVPGKSLGGIRLGETPRAVRASLGKGFGVCNDCERLTWYYTYERFHSQGLAVEFEHGHVAAIYTLWRPGGWHSSNGLRLGASPVAVHERAKRIHTIVCSDYVALVTDTPRTRTAYYVYNGSLWGFGLFLADWSPCR